MRNLARGLGREPSHPVSTGCGIADPGLQPSQKTGQAAVLCRPCGRPFQVTEPTPGRDAATSPWLQWIGPATRQPPPRRHGTSLTHPRPQEPEFTVTRSYPGCCWPAPGNAPLTRVLTPAARAPAPYSRRYRHVPDPARTPHPGRRRSARTASTQRERLSRCRAA